MTFAMFIPSIIICAAFLVGAIYLVIVTPTPQPFPKGHIHEYDPTGEYTYKHQNPRFK